jgi:hypothetical protein
LLLKYRYLFTRIVHSELRSGGAADSSVSAPTINPQEAPITPGSLKKLMGEPEGGEKKFYRECLCEAD